MNSIHIGIAGLRRALEPHRPTRAVATVIVAERYGYSLPIRPTTSTSTCSHKPVYEGRGRAAAGDVPGALRALDAALALWRGIPLCGVPGPPADSDRARLVDLRLVAVEDRAEVILDLEGGATLTTGLAFLLRERRLRERTSAILMLALYRHGRQAGVATAAPPNPYRRARESTSPCRGARPHAAR